jgi:hypothetical protein
VSILNIDLNVILNMPAGPEMDALVAKEVIGYTVDFEEDQRTDPAGHRVWFILVKGEKARRAAIPKFSTDVEAAWKVAAKMRSRGEELSLQHGNMVKGAPGTAAWTARFRNADEFATAVTPSLAICRAALLATRSGKQPSNNIVPGIFFSAVEKELAKRMGPIAPIIVEDKIAEFGEARETFPKDRAEPLLQAISEEIADSSERAPFVKSMTDLLHVRQSTNQPPAASAVNASLPGVFFSTIESELAKIMGPIARIIVDDKVTELGESRSSFPKGRAEALVHAIGEEIADGEARASFAEVMAGFFQRKRK